MRPGTITTLLISLVVAIAAAYLGNAWLEDRLATQTTSKVNLAPVVTAATDIGTGAEITEENLVVIQVPKQFVPEGHFSKPEDIIGATARQRVYKGEMLLEPRVLGNQTGSLLAAQLEPGKRAITLNVNEISGVSGFLLPGSWVDVIATSGDQARTLLQRLKIIAVGQQLDSGSGQAVQTRAVTLEVTPKQAEILTAAGSVRLVLRNPDDYKITEFTQEETTPPAQEAAKPSLVEQIAPILKLDRNNKIVEVIRVTEVTEQKFKSEDQ